MQNETDYEFDLRECIEVVIKRKSVVFAAVLAVTLPVAVWNFLSPRIYEVSMIIEPPTSAITDTGVQGWDSVMNIKAKIEAGAYNDEILGDMKLPEELPQFSVALPKDTRMIRISLNREADQAALGEKILFKLMEKINSSYADVIEDKRNKIDNQIKVVQSQIRTKENEIKLKSEQFKILDARERQFVEDIKDIRTNSNKLLEKRESVLEKKDDKDNFAAMFYAATLQQNTSNLAQLQNQLAELKSKKEGVTSEIEGLKNSISESRIEIADLSMVKGGVQNIQVVQKPRRASRPVGPKRSRNTLLAGLAGLMLGVLSALFIEFWKNPSA